MSPAVPDPVGDPPVAFVPPLPEGPVLDAPLAPLVVSVALASGVDGIASAGHPIDANAERTMSSEKRSRRLDMPVECAREKP